MSNLLTRFATSSIMTRFARDERGVTVIEYAVLGALIIVVALAAITLLGTNVSTVLNKVATTI